MKFNFICIVIVISCSVCESNVLDDYSGLFNKQNDVPPLPDYDRPNFYPKHKYVFDNMLTEDYDDKKGDIFDYESLPDKIRQFQEVIDWERSQLHKHRPQHDIHPRLQYLLDQLDNPERFELDLTRLDKPKLYRLEDDLGFRLDSETESDIKDIFDDPMFYGAEHRLAHDKIKEENEDYHFMHGDNTPRINDDTGEITKNRFSNVPVVKSSSEFAYAPSDMRFYRKIEDTTERIDVTTKSNEINYPLEKLSVNLRSDQEPPVNNNNQASSLTQDSGHKDASIQVVPLQPSLADVDSTGVYIIAIVAGISAAASVGLIAVAIGWYNLQKHVKNASDVEYPAYGVTGPNKDISPSGDRRLAQSAQMYHYQHQKQQIIAMERAPPGERHGSASEAESDEENEEGDYTVYECPGLAPTGEMEVKNPLFQDDPTPAQTPATKVTSEEKK